MGRIGFEQQLMVNEEIAKRTIALDVLRNGGERVVPVAHLTERFPSFPPRHGRFAGNVMNPGLPIMDSVKFDCNGLRIRSIGRSLHQWVEDVMAIGHVAELCVIDEEFDTTIYHLSMAQPSGSHVSF